MNAPASPLTAELDAALQWWQLAGVEHDFADDATAWLAEEAPEPPVDTRVTRRERPAAEPETPPQPIIERVDLLGSSPPADLATFRQWWLEAPGLDAIGPRGRIAARGPADPELMVLVIDPEPGDRETLLSGPQGQLLSRIIAAMGFEEDGVYIASALPRSTPMADTAALAAGGMDAVTLHHVNLVAPQRLLAFGANIPPLLGHELTNGIVHLREINQNSKKIPLLVSEGLDSMMSSPSLKARFWRRWIEWSALK